MKPVDLLADFRSPHRADDTAKPYLYSDETVYGWMAEAEREAALRGDLLYDEDTPATCRIPIVAGKSRYRMDKRIIRVDELWMDRPATGVPTNSRRIALRDQSNAFRRTGRHFFDRRFNPDSNIAPPGTDYGNDWYGGNGALQLGNRIHEASIDQRGLSIYTIPDTSFTTDPAVFRLCCFRHPLEPIKNDESCFEIDDIHHDGLIHWLLHRAYYGRDDEESDGAKSDKELEAFEARFGPRPDAKTMQQQQDGQSDRTAYGGY